MSKKTDNKDPYFIGHIMVVPPGKVLPQINGLTTFWEKELGVILVSDDEVEKLDLAPGQKIQFKILPSDKQRSKTTIMIYDVKKVKQ
ncbi:MAG: hypothetical protein AB8F74_00755 [Saprospiraceae bacterium]